MKRIFHLMMLNIVILSIASGTLLTSSAQSDDVNTLVAGHNTFAFDFFHEIGASANTNLIFSPFSISQAFGMLMAAARDNTAAQMANTLHYTLPQETLHPAFATLNANLSNRETPSNSTGDRLQFNIANSIWAQDGFPFRAAYMDLLQDFYDGGLQFMDFARAPETAREKINDWIEQKTANKIQEMIPPGIINSATQLVLVNAIYFNGSWLHPFAEGATQDDLFTQLDGSTVTVPMMHQQESLGYLRGNGFQAVELPYLGHDMAMLILLPDAGQFEAVQAQLNNQLFDQTRSALLPQDVQLTMPRFEFETDLNLKTFLQTMGMTDVFDPNAANLTGMFDPADVGVNLFVSAALHKAFIGVDESGTEAAAATALMVEATSAPMPTEPVVLRLDRPFIYTIYDRQTGVILFLGQVMNPAQ